jgi:xylulokinase
MVVMPDLVMGIDIGTSSVKGIICDGSGNIVVQSTREQNFSAPQPGFVEESPEIWWINVGWVIRDCLSHPAINPKRIVGLGVTGMVPAIILVGEDGQPLRPAILQNDARAINEIEELKNTFDSQFFFEKTGASINQQSIGPKLRWLQRHEPDVWAKTTRILGSYDYINFRLTGNFSIESNWALESGLYDLHKKSWDPDLIKAANIMLNQLPEIHDPTEMIGRVSIQASEFTGLPSGIPVVAGTADHIGAALAVGLKDAGDLLIKFGSAGDILFVSDQFFIDPRLYIDYHDIPGKYLINGCMATSGSLVKWVVQQFFQSDIELAAKAGQNIYEFLDNQAEKIAAGSEGLLVLPYFLGEKTPILDPYARGVFAGMTLFHTRYHLYRAVLESIVFGFRHHVQVLAERNQYPKRIIASEGGATSRLWRQIAADVLNCPIQYLANNPGSSLGAAFVAGIGVGLFTSWNDIDRFVAIEDVTTPNPANTGIYDRQYQLFRQVYEDLKADFRKMSTK